MTVQLIQSLDASVFTVVIATDEAIATLNPILPAGMRPLAATDADKDARYHFDNGNLSLWVMGAGKATDLNTESLRKLLTAAVRKANELKRTALQVVFMGSPGLGLTEYYAVALGETPLLANYQFIKYQTEPKKNTLQAVHILTNLADAERLVAMGAKTATATNIARDLVNEPPNVIYPETLAGAAQQLGQQFGFQTTVLDKQKIEDLKMGGLLAVNKGSLLPPTFTILEHKPANAQNTQPIVLVGKGITFDTGGLSLKPADSMVGMKGDMAGAAAVIGTFVSLAANQLPYHVIGLIPSTDNRPGYNAYTPNDVIQMYDGTWVEVLNTDAEGRMILADALAWAKQYNPALVIDLATLTGAAVIAVGQVATALYSTADTVVTQRLLEAAESTFERCVQFPLWDEYGEMIKSDVGDIKNIGQGRYAGSITAAKFLQHFTAYPWVHLDIAGPAYLDAASQYRPKYGTGVGVRLLTEFIRRFGS